MKKHHAQSLQKGSRTPLPVLRKEKASKEGENHPRTIEEARAQGLRFFEEVKGAKVIVRRQAFRGGQAKDGQATVE